MCVRHICGIHPCSLSPSPSWGQPQHHPQATGTWTRSSQSKILGIQPKGLVQLDM